MPRLPLRVFHQVVDDLAEHSQRLINIARLLEPLPLSRRLLLPLGASQVHEMQFARPNNLHPISEGPGLNGQGEDGMRPRTLEIHLSSSNMSIPGALH